MSFDRVQHQAAAVRLLRAAVAGGRLPHALLFVGPRGVGKGLAARELAKLLFCESPRAAGAAAPAGGPDPCDACTHCLRVDRGSHPDLYWYRKEPDRTEFRLPLVVRRDGPDGTPPWLTVTVTESVVLTPMEARRTVTVLDDAELMNASAQNALLKCLEEPSPHAVLVLLASDASRLFGTILSRCQWVRFRPLPDAFVAARLKDVAPEASAEEAAYVSRFAGGSIEQAARLARSGFWDLKRRLVAEVAAMDEAVALGLADAVGQWSRRQARAEEAKAGSAEETAIRRAGACLALAAVASALRDGGVLASGAAGAVGLVNADQREALAALATWPAEALARGVDILADAQYAIIRYVHTDLATENALIQVSRLRPRAAGSFSRRP